MDSFSPSSPEVSLPSFLTPTQWNTLFSITATIIHPIDSLPPSTPTANPIPLAHATASSFNLPFATTLAKVLASLPSQKLTEITDTLDILASSIYSLSLLSSPFPFHTHRHKTRNSLLLAWTSNPPARFPTVRPTILFITSLTIATFIRACPNVWQSATGYSIPPPLSSTWPPETDDEPSFYRFNFVAPNEVTGVHWDAIIIGSGCGGGVIAQTISEAGLKILVVEKGSWTPTDEFPLQDASGLYEKGLNMRSADGSIAIMAGSTWGGGSTVNWGGSLKTQEYVRRGWAEKEGLGLFMEEGFKECLDNVCDRMGVNDVGLQHNHRNQMMLEGAGKLGWEAGVIPQNSGPEHRCGFCGNGCGGRKGARKMGTTQTFLPDAARAGAKFMTDLQVTKILFEDDTRSKATGLVGTWNGSSVTLKASRVIVSAGSLHSPALLLRSGLSPSIPTIGQNLYLHPAALVWGHFHEITTPTEGSPMTTIMTEFENLDGEGHGFKLETPLMALGNFGAAMPWKGAEEWKKDFANFQRMSNLVILHRDSVPGRVELGEDGEPRIVYTPSREDREMMFLAVEACTKILFATGAVKIVTPVAGYPAFERPSSSSSAAIEKAFETWLEGLHAYCSPPSSWSSWLTSLGSGEKSEKPVLPLVGTPYLTAHQMGSCRMSVRREDGGVVDEKGRVWGVEGLWVADASILPSATGVNPMISTMAVSQWVGRGIAREWKEREVEGAGM